MKPEWDRVLAFLLEKALKQLPPGTSIVANRYDVERWIAETPATAHSSLELVVTQDGDYDKTVSARLKNDPRVTTVKRKFDLEG